VGAIHNCERKVGEASRRWAYCRHPHPVPPEQRRFIGKCFLRKVEVRDHRHLTQLQE